MLICAGNARVVLKATTEDLLLVPKCKQITIQKILSKQRENLQRRRWVDKMRRMLSWGRTEELKLEEGLVGFVLTLN